MSEPKKLFQFVAELPAGHVWRMASFEGLLIFCAPTHSPLVLKDGKLETLTDLPMQPVVFPASAEPW